MFNGLKVGIILRFNIFLTRMRVNAIFLTRRHEDAKARRHKVFYKTKLLINGICFQPFERIERIEPLEHFLGAKTQSFFTKQRC